MDKTKGPTKTILPTHSYLSCGECEFYKYHMAKSGQNPIYNHNCNDPELPKEHKQGFLKGNLNSSKTPNWCRFIDSITNDKLFEFDFIDETGYLTHKGKEKTVAKTFEWQPPIEILKVKKIEGHLLDEYDGYINIEMTNGDQIKYKAKSISATIGNYQCKITLYVNDYLIENFDENYMGNRGSFIGDILFAYKKEYLEKDI